MRELRFTTASYLLLAMGWFWLALFVALGRPTPVNSGANFGSLACLWFAPLALLAAIAGLFFDRRKPPSLVAFVASLATSLLVLGMG